METLPLTHKEMVAALPELVTRVHNLKSKHYNGCGFHYSLVKTLNYLEMARQALDLDPEDPVEKFFFEVNYDCLMEQVAKAEASCE